MERIFIITNIRGQGSLNPYWCTEGNLLLHFTFTVYSEDVSPYILSQILKGA